MPGFAELDAIKKRIPLGPKAFYHGETTVSKRDLDDFLWQTHYEINPRCVDYWEEVKHHYLDPMPTGLFFHVPTKFLWPDVHAFIVYTERLYGCEQLFVRAHEQWHAAEFFGLKEPGMKGWPAELRANTMAGVECKMDGYSTEEVNELLLGKYSRVDLLRK
jgi:hypothetical protein